MGPTSGARALGPHIQIKWNGCAQQSIRSESSPKKSHLGVPLGKTSVSPNAVLKGSETAVTHSHTVAAYTDTASLSHCHGVRSHSYTATLSLYAQSLCHAVTLYTVTVYTGNATATLPHCDCVQGQSVTTPHCRCVHIRTVAAYTVT